tara:strand:- start:123 stop:425 length:303 start_codon:yes stop_codon:yes gene_type:complete
MYTYKVDIYDNNERDTLLYNKEFSNIREMAASLDVSSATICNHVSGKKPSRCLRRYEFQKIKSNDSIFIKLFKDIMKLGSDDERMDYLKMVISNNLIQSL